MDQESEKKERKIAAIDETAGRATKGFPQRDPALAKKKKKKKV